MIRPKEAAFFPIRLSGVTIFLALTGRAYRDTGEIENAFLFTSAAPALRSRQLGLALRGEGERVTWRCSFTPLATRSAPTNRNTDFFQGLYTAAVTGNGGGGNVLVEVYEVQ